MSKARRRWFLPWWIRRHHDRKATVARLRALHGDNCWRCDHKMRFEGVPNCGKAATIEHLLPLSKGGTWALANLRLCHAGCNRHLGDRLPEQKERMRINPDARRGERAEAPAGPRPDPFPAGHASVDRSGYMPGE